MDHSELQSEEKLFVLEITSSRGKEDKNRTLIQSKDLFFREHLILGKKVGNVFSVNKRLGLPLRKYGNPTYN